MTVSHPRPKDAKKIAERVEALGKLNDRHRKLSLAGDALGLQELAAEYEARRMTRTAQMIRIEASAILKYATAS